MSFLRYGLLALRVDVAPVLRPGSSPDMVRTAHPGHSGPRARTTIEGLCHPTSRAHDPVAIVDNVVTIGSKYVNMADINVTALKQRRPTYDPDGEPIWDVIELLFFVYRDFVGGPDEVLEKLRFDSEHHRVLTLYTRDNG